MTTQCYFKHTGITSEAIDDQSLEFQALRIVCLGKITITKLANQLSIGLGIKLSNRSAHQLIRNLREFGCPIVGDSSGIWIANKNEDIIDFANRIEHKAKSDIASMMNLRKKMLSIAKINLPSLFDSLI